MNRGDRVLVTGATGFIGGYLVSAMLKRGNRVVAAARPKDGRSPEQRMRNLMAFFGQDPGDRLEVIEIRLDEPDLGLTRKDAAGIRSGVRHILHCAAETSFSARKRDQVRRTNVDGLVNVFRTVGGDSHFHYVSTAYSTGKREGVCREELVRVREFNNEYERSKHEAEMEIARLCRSSGTRLSIYRPSIVYGDSVSGESLRFNALYYPVRIILFLRDSLTRSLNHGDGRRARELGVSIDDRGGMEMPMSIPDMGGCMNMIPVDYLVSALMELMRSGVSDVFHIVNHNYNVIDDIIGYIGDEFGITGITSAPGGRGRGPTPLEMLMDGYLKLYYPYVSDRRVFDDARTGEVLGGSGLRCPQLDPGSFSRCMRFALEKGWGSGITI